MDYLDLRLLYKVNWPIDYFTAIEIVHIYLFWQSIDCFQDD